MVLSRKERAKINKANRAKGYRVERESVLKLREKGCWVKRLWQKEQRGEMSPVDYIYWDPIRKVFGFGQAKYTKNLLTQLEIELLRFLSQKYGLEIMFSWRDYGIKFEVLIPIS